METVRPLGARLHHTASSLIIFLQDDRIKLFNTVEKDVYFVKQ